MARYYGKTRERGYGSDHQKLRLQLLAKWQPGDPCARCGQPLLGPPDRIHLGHTEDRTGYTGLEHSDCNCAEGARRGNRQQPRSLVMLKAGNPVCHGCGQPYHYAARSCEMCGAHYHPSYGEQRTCSRACGVKLRRTNGNAGPPRRRTCECPTGQSHICFVRISWSKCAECGGLFIQQGRPKHVTCSEECRARQQARYRAEYGARESTRERARKDNDRKGEARGWPRGKGVYNVGKEPWNKGASRDW